MMRYHKLYNVTKYTRFRQWIHFTQHKVVNSNVKTYILVTLLKEWPKIMYLNPRQSNQNIQGLG